MWCRDTSQGLHCLCIVQGSIAGAAAKHGAFVIGPINAHACGNFTAASSLLEPLEHLHINMANLVAHVWHCVKDSMAAMPDEVRTPTTLPRRRCRMRCSHTSSPTTPPTLPRPPRTTGAERATCLTTQLWTLHPSPCAEHVGLPGALLAARRLCCGWQQCACRAWQPRSRGRGSGSGPHAAGCARVTL